jgi:hypothetical protein
MDHLVRPQQQRLRNCQAERLGGLEVDRELELTGLVDRQIGGLGTFEDPVHEIRGVPKQIGKVLSTSASALHLQEFRELPDGPGPVISEELLPGEQ